MFFIERFGTIRTLSLDKKYVHSGESMKSEAPLEKLCLQAAKKT
jgi:hypothetical protein